MEDEQQQFSGELNQSSSPVRQFSLHTQNSMGELKAQSITTLKSMAWSCLDLIYYHYIWLYFKAR